MASKMKLSMEATKNLEQMASNLNLRRNVICRLALGISLGIEEPPSIDDSDYGGMEFNKPTIMGTDEQILSALLTHHFGKKMIPDDLFSTYIRAEIIRGLSIMVSDYNKLNSPSDYFKMLCKNDGEVFID